MFELLKTKGALAIFTTLTKYPKRRFSINELAKQSGVPFATAWGIIRGFDKAGVIDTEKIGRSIAVSLKDSDVTKTIISIVSLPSSPHQLVLKKLRNKLSKIGIRGAHVFGSVAEGKETSNSDLDIAVLLGSGHRTADLDKVTNDIYVSDKVRVVFLIFNDEKTLKEFLNRKTSRRLL